MTIDAGAEPGTSGGIPGDVRALERRVAALEEALKEKYVKVGDAIRLQQKNRYLKYASNEASENSVIMSGDKGAQTAFVVVKG